MDDVQKQRGFFSPEAVLMLSLFGVLDIIDFFIGSVFVVDILATGLYFIWTYFRSQVVAVSQVQEGVREKRGAREEKRAELREKRAAVKKTTMTRKKKWLKYVLLALEWIPVVGMIPGWTLIVYSELKN